MGQVIQNSIGYKEEVIKLAEEKVCKNASDEIEISCHNLWTKYDGYCLWIFGK